jgi:hypothetical protein
LPREDDWKRFAEGWRALGATHLCVNTMGVGLASLAAHIETLQRVKAVLGE